MLIGLSGWLVVVHMYLYYFRMSLSHCRLGNLLVPRTEASIYGARSFTVLGPVSWSSLSPFLQNLSLLPEQFRR